MPDTLSVDIKASLAWLFSETLSLSTVVDNATLEYDESLADGDGDDEVDLLWHGQRMLAAATSDNLDLTALATTLFGGALALNFAQIKAILLINTSTVPGDVLQLGGATNAFAAPFANDADAVVEIGPNSPLLLANKKDGWPVTPGAADILRVHNPGTNSVVYQIAIVGNAT